MPVISITKTGRVFLIAAMLLLGGCSSESAKLYWLNSADAAVDFRSDLADERLRFFVVHGFAKEIPGVSHLEYDECYNDVELTSIEGTSDMLESPEHARLNQVARDYAATYNVLVRDHIDRQKGQPCRLGS